MQPIAEPSWLSAKIDQRLAHLDEHGAIDIAIESKIEPIIMMFLTEPGEGLKPGSPEFERWERACDNCDAYVEIGDKLMSGQSTRTIRGQVIIVTFACCPTCVELP